MALRYRDRRPQNDTLPQAFQHMTGLLTLPTDQRSACSQCNAFTYTCKQPAPLLRAPPMSRATLLHTVELDSYAAAELLLRFGWSQPAVLNMANEWNCGGAWCEKLGSQEEDLFRSSTLPLSLWPRRREQDNRLPEFEEALPRADSSIYGFSEAGAVYSPYVLVCRCRDGSALLDNAQFVVSVVSSAAQDLRSGRPWFQPFDETLTMEKMRSTLWVAAQFGHEVLVLGAFGCGAFKNDPVRMAALYDRLLGPGGEFEGRFRVVLFAVIKSVSNLSAFSGRFPFLAAEQYDSVFAKAASHDSLAAKSTPGAAPFASPSSQPMPLSHPASTLSQTEKNFLKHCKVVRDIWKLEDQKLRGERLAATQEQKLSKKVAAMKVVRDMLEFLAEDSDLRQKNIDVVRASVDAAPDL